MDYSVSGNNTPVDYAAEYMWYEKECVKLAENGNNEELSKLSEEELLKRWRTVREYLRNMELAEYRIAKSFSIKENLFGLMFIEPFQMEQHQKSDLISVSQN